MIALNIPNIGREELRAASKNIKDGWLVGGKYIFKFENQFKKYININYAITCASGTSALHLALRAIGVEKKDEIIIPSVSFIATANAVLYCNCSPIFMDVDEYLNIDLKKLEKFFLEKTFLKKGRLINKKTNRTIKAMIVVHVFGNSADIINLKRLCLKYKIKLIEDAAAALGSFYYKKKIKKHLGTFGDVGCFSFNANKIITSSGGGMVVTNNKTLAKKIRFLSDQAKENNVTFTHNDIGYNYRLSNLNCSIGFEQLKKINLFLKIKKENLKIYQSYLNLKKIEILSGPKYSLSNNWSYVIKFKSKKNMTLKAINYLKKKKIETRPIWKLLFEQKKYQKFQRFKTNYSKKRIFNKLCIPSSTNLTIKQIKYVSNKINKFCKEAIN
jgi:perosamine synthetase